MQNNQYQIDMCHGALFGKIMIFSVPLIISMLLQLMFNAADLIVIGHYASHEAMAGIGAALNINGLIVHLMGGISIGSNVLAARYFGARDAKNMQHTLQTSMAFSFFGGLFFMILGLFLLKPLLLLLGTPANVLPKSIQYLRICFLGIPALSIYNIGCSILRAIGDTKRPLYFLAIAGVLNVLLNLFFVTKCGMDVAGVATATIISQYLSAVLTVIVLCRTRGAFRMKFSMLRFHKPIFKEMIRIGLPAGFQSTCFSVSNMTIQSAINTFGSYAIAGTAAEIAIEVFLWAGSSSLHMTAISFVAQNYGGRKYKRIQRCIFMCVGISMLLGAAVSGGLLLFKEPLLAMFNPDPQVIKWGIIRMNIMFCTFLLGAVMDVLSGCLRGLGYSLTATLSTFSGSCIFRIFWVLVIYPYCKTMEFLLISYPISWGLTAVFNGIFLYVICHRMFQEQIKQHSSI